MTAATETSYDPVNNIIHYQQGGFNSIEAIRANTQRVGAMVKEARRRHGCAHVLVIKNDAIVQSSEAVQEISKGRGEVLSGPLDRMAVVIESGLSRMQVQRLYAGDERRRCFQSIEEARAWLMSDAATGRAA